MSEFLTKIIVPNGFIKNEGNKYTLGISICYKLNIDKIISKNEELLEDPDNYSEEVKKIIKDIKNPDLNSYEKHIEVKGIKSKKVTLIKPNNKTKSLSENDKKDLLGNLLPDDSITKEEILVEKPVNKVKPLYKGLIDFTLNDFKIENNKVVLNDKKGLYKRIKTELVDGDDKNFGFYDKSNTIYDHGKNLNSKSKNEFIKNNLNKIKSKDFESIFNPKKDDVEVDINVIINNFNIIQENKILCRELGYIQDYEINIITSGLDKNKKEIQEKEFLLKVSNESNDSNSYTNCRLIKLNKKYAFLPARAKSDFSNHFSSSLLKKNELKLKNYSDISVQQNLFNEKLTEQQTKGLILTHDKLHEIVTPKTFDEKTKVSNIIWDDETLYEGFVIFLNDLKEKKYYSLTKRKTELYQGDKSNLKEEEAFLKIDNFIEYIDKQGELKHEVSNVICEYTGEQFGLEGVFGKDVKKDKKEYRANFIENPDTEMLLNSKNIFDENLIYRVFPYREVEYNEAFKLGEFKYCFDYSYPENTAKLEFKKQYQMGAFLGFMNGYSLPLTPDDLPVDLREKSLTIEDIVGNDESCISHEYTYNSLDSKQPLTITTKTEDSSINELIVKSDDINDRKQFVSCINVWGPTDTLRNIWLNENRNLAKLEQINKGLSFKLLKEAGEEKLNDSKNSKVYKNKYSDFLTNPQVSGFRVAMSYYEDFYKDYNAQIGDLTGKENIIEKKFKHKIDKIKFYNQKEIEIIASGAKQKTFINNKNKNIDINLKKGAQLYLQFTSFNTKDVDSENRILDSVANQFWWNKAGFVEKIDTRNISMNNTGVLRDIEENNKLLKSLIENEVVTNTIKLTHAVKKPLITPTILNIDSNDSNFTSDIIHENGAIANSEYNGKYELGKNIFGKRDIKNKDDKTNYDKYSESTVVQLDLWAHFERLDAFTYINSENNKPKTSFVENILATGNLELWVRKEEYYDGNDDYLQLDTGRTTPELPLTTFNNQNKFVSELKIEFSEKELNELKKYNDTVKKLTEEEKEKYLKQKHRDNEFLYLKTKLKIKLDIGTTKFEEREYVLKNTSKFVGYFNKTINKANEEKDDNIIPVGEELEQFTLYSKPFKIMVLNNKKPEKLEVKYAITTIQEEKNRKSNKVIESKQQGNLITLYFDRGRLSSGKNERIAFVLKDGNEDSYYQYYDKHDLFSKIGKDIMSDRNESENLNNQFLNKDNFLTDIQNKSYDCKWHQNENILSYEPVFDIEKNLWKVVIEFNDIKDEKYLSNLNNPFIQLTLVNFQPFSMNYGKGENAFEHDCRFSVPTKSTWAYLLPKRECNVSNFDKPGLFDKDGYFDVNLKFGKSSLSWLRNFDGSKPKLRTNFIVAVQATRDNMIWENIGSKIKITDQYSTKKEYHTLINNEKDCESGIINNKFIFDKVKGECKYRIIVTEIEWFDESIKFDSLGNYNNILNDERFRKRYIEIIY